VLAALRVGDGARRCWRRVGGSSVQEWSCGALLPGSVVLVTDHPEDLDDTVVRPSPRAATPRPLVGGSGAGLDDTVLSPRLLRDAGDPDDTVVRPRATSVVTPHVPPAPRPAPAAGARGPRRTHAVRIGSTVHPLDVPVVVGRRPSPPRVLHGPVPRLVAVASGGGVVSSSHLDVRQEGDVVVVTDLRSTNGTRVAQPGRPAVQLRQGESLTVLAGTTIDLGDAVLLEILPPQRLTLKDGPQP